MPITDPFKRKEYARLSMAIKKAKEENQSQEIINQLFDERKKILQFIPEGIKSINGINEGINQKEGINESIKKGINSSESINGIKSINDKQFIPKKDFIPKNGINGINSDFIPKTEKSIKTEQSQNVQNTEQKESVRTETEQIENISLQPQIEKELLNRLEPNNLTQEEKEIALKVIRTITNKRKKDRHLTIDYHILTSKPKENDKDGIIAKLQEEAKLNRKIITEYMLLKENYFSQIVQLKKTYGINPNQKSV